MDQATVESAPVLSERKRTLGDDLHQFQAFKERLLFEMPELADEETEDLLLNSIGAANNLTGRLAKMLFAARHEEGKAEAVSKMAAELSRKAKQHAARSKRIREVVLQFMRMASIKKLDELGVMAWPLAPKQSVAIAPDAKLPKTLLTRKMVETPNKAAIKERLLAKKKVKGCALQWGEWAISVKFGA